MEPHQQESVLLSLLTSRAAKGRDVKAYAHATAETQVAIKESFAARPLSRSVQIPVNAQEPGFLEVFPRVASRPPRLLQELEALMVDRLRSADKAASVTQLLPKDRDPRMAANLSLDVHRQVFAAFVSGFSTYTSLLTRVQAEFEHALAEGVRCAASNVQVREALGREAERRETAEREARETIMAEEYEFRRAAFAALQDTRERTARLVKRAAAAEKDLATVRSEEARLRIRVNALATAAARLKAQAAKDAAWAAAPTSAALSARTVGPLTQEDAAYLAAEYTSNAAPPLAAPGSPTMGPAPPASTKSVAPSG